MAQFYISNDDQGDVRRCNESRDARMPITITGQTDEGRIKAFTGVVQSVEYEARRPPGWRWRVTIRD